MRLFVAFDPFAAIRAALAAFIAAVQRHPDAAALDARWVEIANAHVTLKFIGDASSAQADAIQQALAAVPFSGPLTLRFVGIGFFPNARHPQVLWAGVEPKLPFAGLAESIEAALGPLGTASRQRSLSPHLTLARLRRKSKLKSDLRNFMENLANEEQASFGQATVNEFHLYQSILKSSGAEHTRLATYRLGRGGEA